MRFAGRWAALAFAYATAVQALPWLEPAQTSAGLVAMAGKSAKPAAAPGIRRGAFPLGLRRRQEQQQFPSNWCGFIGGSPGELSIAAEVLATILTKNADRRRALLCAVDDLCILR